MRSGLSYSFARIFKALRGLGSDRGGNVAIVVALTLVPMIVAVGASFDYIRTYNVRQRMQSDLDTALIAAVKEIDTDVRRATGLDRVVRRLADDRERGGFDLRGETTL